MEHSRQSLKRARHREQIAARAEREEDKRRKETARQRQALEARRRELREQRMIEQAVVLTEEADQRIQKLAVLLRAWLKHIPEPLDFEAMKKDLPDLDVGVDGEPFPLPQWEEYAPAPRSPLRRLLGGRRQDARLEEAETAYAQALERYRAAEAERRQRLEQLHAERDAALTAEQHAIRLHNKEIDDFQALVFEGDRHAVTHYFEQVFSKIVDKLDVPRTKRIAYVPESKLLLVEWHVPNIDIVPREKEHRYNKARGAIEVSKWRPITLVREIYHNLLAQMALRAVATGFSADPNWLVETVVFNGVLLERPEPRPADGTDSATDTDAATSDDAAAAPAADEPAAVPGPCVFSMRATRHQFAKIKLDSLTDTEPLEQVRRRFSPRISPFPDEQVAVEPLLPYDLAEPSAAAPEGTEPELGRLALTTMSTQELDALIEQMLERMGYEVAVIRPEDDDCDALATRQTPQGEERLVVHLRRVVRVAGPADVRALMRAIRRERAQSGLLLVTGGYDTRAFECAAGKPVRLYDSHSLLALLHKHGLATDRSQPARPDSGGGSVERLEARSADEHRSDDDLRAAAG
ncbi:MAG TPA: restriction endonuclease [Actinopolymorphaceae bacterium]